MEYKKDIEVIENVISKLIYYNLELEEGSIEALRNCMASHKAITEASVGELQTYMPNIFIKALSKDFVIIKRRK